MPQDSPSLFGTEVSRDQDQVVLDSIDVSSHGVTASPETGLLSGFAGDNLPDMTGDQITVPNKDTTADLDHSIIPTQETDVPENMLVDAVPGPSTLSDDLHDAMPDDPVSPGDTPGADMSFQESDVAVALSLADCIPGFYRMLDLVNDNGNDGLGVSSFVYSA